MSRVPSALEPRFDFDGMWVAVSGRFGAPMPSVSIGLVLTGGMITASALAIGMVSGEPIAVVLLVAIGFVLAAVQLPLLPEASPTGDSCALQRTPLRVDGRGVLVDARRARWQDVVDAGLGVDSMGRRVLFITMKSPARQVRVPASETPDTALVWLVAEIRRRREELSVPQREVHVIQEQARRLVGRR